MKVLIIICMLLQLPALAQEGTRWRELTFDEALAAAKEEGKLVFVDCYTSWCGPCKNMAEKVFPRKEAGEFFNPRFVCVKYDMEKGEGLELAKRFDVHAYPTFVIVRPDGTVQHKLVGGGELEEFIARVEKGLDENTNLLALREKYQKGGMDKAQLMGYYEALEEADAREEAAQVYHELWGKLSEEEKTEAKYWGLLENETCVVGTPAFDFLLGHLDALRENVGRDRVDRFVTKYYWEVLSDYVMGYADEKSPAIEVLEKQVPTLGVKGQENLNRFMELAGLVARGESEKLAKLIEERMEGMNAGTLQTYAYGYRGIAWGRDGDVPENYGELGRKLAELTVAKMEKEAETMTAKDLQCYLLALSGFGEEDESKMAERVVKVGDKVLSRQTEAPEAEQVKYFLNRYKKQLEKK